MRLFIVSDVQGNYAVKRRKQSNFTAESDHNKNHRIITKMKPFNEKVRHNRSTTLF